jgi:hypothetical protein
MYLFEFVESDVHQPPRSQDFEHLVDQIPGDGLDQPQRPLDRVLGVPDLAQVVENGLQSSVHDAF